MITKLKKYLEEKGLEANVEIEEDKMTSETYTKQEIKVSPLLFTTHFMKFFEEFIRLFKEYEFDSEWKEKITQLKIIYLDLIQLYAEYKSVTTEYGKSEMEKNLRVYINKNYPILSEFFDLCWETFDCN